uniref:Vesicle transport protein n=1 Tax=Chromera velia CCMP2878 TaxID=1169474 RepID=A0A0G4I5H9_9ALVE|mmetsp:Transcript_19581/g.39427  ORF Transcript_19581/g.39427 Transcript_19581/m.39427 type:complete len:260 (+) Transcript_19581:299-1078(+)|eukprot:Cvel_11184.t1-p1 / transcript=Cvel_11184.t1 / gene=Cvel_11184 / organism=Chromera_velia_CCMP2878 / gene_product=Protein transport protein SFT2, putative / transcript_product=Protein transport protein SFT2, putative / location=Cvel_scaffold694:33886-39045(+) / protein_length=259 / sequence_SO=supercontig / SO=protein_coding / is_pseudo=false
MSSSNNFDSFAANLNFYQAPPGQPTATTGQTASSNNPNAKLMGFMNPFAGGGESPTNAANEAGEPEETQGLVGMAQKGIAKAAAGLGNMGERARNMATGASGAVEEASMTQTRLIMFAVGAAVGSLFMFLAFMFLPMLVIAPSKFALLFTSGSLCFMVSIASLKGHRAFLSHMISRERLPFSTCYVLSLGLTLWSTLYARSYLLTLLFSLLQLISLAYFMMSYLPGGTRTLNFLGGMCWGFISKLITGRSGSQGTPLPL